MTVNRSFFQHPDTGGDVEVMYCFGWVTFEVDAPDADESLEWTEERRAAKIEETEKLIRDFLHGSLKIRAGSLCAAEELASLVARDQWEGFEED